MSYKSSSCGYHGAAGVDAYAASKTALLGITKVNFFSIFVLNKLTFNFLRPTPPSWPRTAFE